jgi:hypothetical protein
MAAMRAAFLGNDRIKSEIGRANGMKNNTYLPQDQEKRFFCTCTKSSPEYSSLNVGILVQKLHALFKAPETALTAT